MQQWEPIFHGPSASRVHEVVQGIAGLLADHGPNPFYYLSSGYGSAALFHGYLAVCSDDPGRRLAHAAHAETCINQGIELLGQTQTRPWGLFCGAAGVGWTIDRLSRMGLLEWDPGEDPNEALDEGLMDHLAGACEPWRGRTELISGLAGMGIYLLERPAQATHEGIWRRVVDHVEALAEWHGETCTWFDPPDRIHPLQKKECPSGCYNLGLSHGIPGVMVFLARAHSAGHERAGRLARGSAQWLLATQAPNPDGSRFLSMLKKEPSAFPGSRVAWCYGDLGIALALAGTADALSDPGLAGAAVAIGDRILARSRATWLVKDHGLCHGTAGIAHLFNRLFQATGLQRYKEMAVELFEEVVAAWQPSAGGYPAFRSNLSQPGRGARLEPDPAGLLEGNLGVALALLAACHPVEPLWDGFLLADPTPGSLKGLLA